MKESKHLSETGKLIIERANTPENLLNLVSQAQVSFEMDFKTEKEFLRDIERQFIRPWGKEAK